MDRKTPFIDIIRGLVPFFVTRQVFAGAGRVGIGTEGRTQGFQLSQRADFFEVEVGLETTLKRPIINTRDEPHADADKYRRLHVIIGDANLAELSTYLKVGTTSLVLAMIEARALPRDLAIEEPGRGAAGDQPRPVADAQGAAARRPADDGDRGAAGLPRAGGEVRGDAGGDRRADHRRAAPVGRGAATTSRSTRCAAPTGWTGRPSCGCWRATARGTGSSWGDSRLHLVDLQYSDVRPDKGLYNRLVARGSMQRLLTDDEVTRAMTAPPSDTRAFFRGECLRRYPAQVAAASWDSVVFDLGRENLVRIPTMEPLRGTREHVGALFEASATAQELVDTITGS